MQKSWIMFPVVAVFVFLISCRPKTNFTATPPPKLVTGNKVDSLNGVYVYYNGSIAHVAGRNVRNGYNLGLKYQCVEFVKRYYYEHYHHKMPDTYGNAKDFFDPAIKDGGLNKKRDLLQFKNGSFSKPQVGDLVVMDATTYNQYGHVCIVSRAKDNKVEIIQQNPGPLAPSRAEYGLLKMDGRYTLVGVHILGWLRKQEL